MSSHVDGTNVSSWMFFVVCFLLSEPHHGSSSNTELDKYKGLQLSALNNFRSENMETNVEMSLFFATFEAPL